MYSVVLMVAVTTGGDTASFGKKDSGGCTGYTAGCSGSCHGSGFLGMRNGGGLFSKHKGSGCHGTATYAGGCTGSSVAMTPAPAPVVAAPAGCTGCTGYTAGCHGSSCHGGGFLGMRNGGGLFSGKHKKGAGCSGGCYGG